MIHIFKIILCVWGGKFMNNPTNYGYEENPYQVVLVSTLNRVFLMMFAGLAVTTFAAFIAVSVPAVYMTIFSSAFTFYALIITELILVIAISAGMKKMSAATAATLFYIYAFVNGLTLSAIFVVYEVTSIYAAFGVSCMVFGVMALIGSQTKRDLTNLRGYLMMGLIGIIIASVLNLFLGNNLFDVIISIIAVIVFIGLTAYDTQKIKRNLEQAVHADNTYDVELVRKISIYGALSLYLDFINLFLRILRLMGRRR